jgi:hypothetical protein
MGKVPLEILMGIRAAGRPGLSAHDVSKAGKEVASIRELDYEQTAGSKDPSDLPEDHIRIAQMDHQANGRDNVDRTGGDRKVGGRGLHNRETGARADPLSGRLDHRGRCIDERDAPKAAVFVDQATVARPEIEEVPAAARQERANGDAVTQILIGSGRPKRVAIGQIVDRESLPPTTRLGPGEQRGARIRRHTDPYRPSR